MKVIRLFILGLILGLFYKWITSRVYTDVEIRMIKHEDPLEMDSTETNYSEALDVKEQPRAAAQPVRPKTKKEILEVLKGIGPASVKRLNNAGVHTFDELAQLEPEQLRNILGSVLKRAGITERQVIAEARKFAQQKLDQE